MDITSRLSEALRTITRENGAWLSADILRGMLGKNVSHEDVVKAARALCEKGVLEERASGEDGYGEQFDLDAQEYREAKSEGRYICPIAGEPRPLSQLAPYFAFPDL